MDVRALVAAQLPGYRVDSVVPLGEGLDNVAYEVNGELIVRFSKEPDPARVDREARLLTTVAGFSPVPVPVPAFTVPEHGCLAYLKVPGRPLVELPRAAWTAHATAIAATLGDLLAALHAVPVERVADLVDPDDQPLVGWRDEAAAIYATVRDAVAGHHDAIERFFNAPPPPAGYPLVFSHNDLGIEHVLVDPGTWTVTGVIDWSDAALVDPAYDFGLLYRDLGPAALDAALDRYAAAADGGLRERAVFYARCGVFEDLGYGLETGRDPYVGKSRAALDWLFENQDPGDGSGWRNPD